MATAGGGCNGARRAGASPRGGSTGVGWRWLLLLGDAVVLIELVLLRGEEASALVGDGYCCWVMQWCSATDRCSPTRSMLSKISPRGLYQRQSEILYQKWVQ
jgi:hypothetical protein